MQDRGSREAEHADLSPSNEKAAKTTMEHSEHLNELLTFSAG